MYATYYTRTCALELTTTCQHPGDLRIDAELKFHSTTKYRFSGPNEGRMRKSRITVMSFVFTSCFSPSCLALLILGWLAVTANASPLWAEDSRASGPATLAPSRPTVLRRLRWKGADTTLSPTRQRPMALFSSTQTPEFGIIQKIKFSVTSNLWYMYEVLNTDEIKN
jgi:hypothetical protein